MEPGTVFSQQTKSGHFVYGRILLNLQPLFEQNILVPVKSALNFFRTSVLVETLDGYTPELIRDPQMKPVVRGVFLLNDALNDGVWEPVGFRPVLGSEIDFPEFVSNHNGRFYLYKGELALLTPINHAVNDKILCRGMALSGGAFASLAAFHMGKAVEGTESWKESLSLEKNDLRFRKPSLRKLVWQLAKHHPPENYAEIARKNGFPVERLLLSDKL